MPTWQGLGSIKRAKAVEIIKQNRNAEGKDVSRKDLSQNEKKKLRKMRKTSLVNK